MTDGKLSLSCPKCKAAVQADQAMAGTRVRCPKCSGAIKVPGTVAASSDDDDWLQLDQPLSSGPQTRPVPDEDPGDEFTIPAAAQKPKPAERGKPGKGKKGSRNPKSQSAGPSKSDALSPPDVPEVLGNADVVSDPKGGDGEAVSPEGQDDLPDWSEADLDAMQFPLSLPSKFTAPSVDVFESGDALGAEQVPKAADAQDVVPADVTTSEYRFPCPVCESAHYAKPDRQGREIKCTDCHSTIVVPPPPKVKPKYDPPMETAPTFQLQQPVDRSEAAESMLEKSAAQLLREAEDSQLDEDLDELYDNPDIAGWFQDVCSIFADPIMGLAFAASASLLAVVAIVMRWTQESGIAVFFSIGAPAGLFALGVLSALGFAIIQGTANRDPRIKDWPFTDPAGWGPRAILATVAVMLSAAPGCVFGLLIAEPISLLWGACVLLSTYILCPVIVLSMIENESVFQPYSQEVISSFQRCKDQWGGLYFTSGLLFFLYFLFVVASPLDALSAVGLTALAFVYARLIGRVAFACGQSVGSQAAEGR